MTDDQLPLPGQPEPASEISGEPAGDDFSGEFDAPEEAPKKRSMFGMGKKKPMKTKKGKVGASNAEDDDLSAFDDGAFVEGEEEEFVEEDWEEFDDKFEGDAGATTKAAAAAKKAKSKNFNRIIIGGTAAIGLVIVFLNMSGGQGGPAAIPPPQQIAANGAANNPNANLSKRDIIYGHTNKNTEESTSDSSAKGKSGVLNDPMLIKDIDTKTRAAEFDDSYYYDQQAAAGEKDTGQGFGGGAPHEVDNAAQPPMPADTAANLPSPAPAPDTLTPMPQGQIPTSPPAAAPAAGVADAMNPPEKTLVQASNTEKGAGDFPTASSFAKAPETTKADSKAAAPQNDKIADAPTEENPFANENASVDTPVNNAAADDMDALPASPVVTQSLSPQPVAQQTPATTAASDAKLDALLNRLDQIEAQLSSVTARQDEQIQKMQQSISALQGKKASAPKAVSASAPTDLTEELPHVPRAAAARQETPPARPVTQKARTASTSKAGSSTRGYVLKSAQPGRAMVAKGGETYTIAVGENLPGLGKILQIYDRGGQWVVRGSSGTISQ